MNDKAEPSVSIPRSTLSLGLLALLASALLSGVYWLTAPRIAEQERKQLLLQLEQVLPGEIFDNAMHEDYIDVSNTLAFPGSQEVRVFRARMDGQPSAAVFRLFAPDGYNGRIHLLIGILASGEISGVRVLDHSETPGLGDWIELERSDWILSFNGRSLTNPEKEGWAVKRDGGEFEQFTGATITPRAVVRAVRRTLEYFEANRQELFTRESEFGIPEGDQDTENG